MPDGRQEAKTLLKSWWEARIARQREIDASIAAKAEFEYLYDKPYANNKAVRVAGPFTVESLSPHRMLGVDENDELIDVAEEQGADYSAPDLVLTKDGVMIARHEPMLDGTTDVASKFPESRKSTRNVDGVPTTAYFASDFTLAEIRTLRALQARANRSQAYNGLFGIPTLDEVIALAKSEGTRLGRSVGIYPEIKHSTFHKGLFGANVFEDKLLTTLHTAYGNVASAPVFIQSFEVSNLQYLNTKTNIKLVQLIDADDVKDDGSMSLVAPYHKPYDFVVKNDSRTFADLLTSSGLDFVKTYADAIGPWKPYLVTTVDDGVDRGEVALKVADQGLDEDVGPEGAEAH